MNKAALVFAAIVTTSLLVATSGCEAPATSATPSASTFFTEDFSFYTQENPNQLFLDSHFSLLGIGRIKGLTIEPPKTIISTEGEAFLPAELERDVRVFLAGENIVIYGHVISATSITAACFKAEETGYTKIEYWGPEPFSDKYMTAEAGAILAGYTPPDFILPVYLNLTPGNYRLKIFSGETLVAVFPFDVWATPVTLLYPVPEISESQAFEIAKQLVPQGVLYAERVMTVLSIGQPESHGIWITSFTGLHITKQELTDFGWQEDSVTSFENAATYSQIWIGIDAQTGEIILKTAWNGIKLGGPVTIIPQ